MYNAGGTQEQGLALLAWSHSFPNFANVSAAKQWAGWTNATVAGSCGWTGVTCVNHRLIINLAYQGLQGEAATKLLHDSSC